MANATMKNGWRMRRFDEMAVIVNDRVDDPSEADVDRYVGLEHLDSGSLTIRRWGSPEDVEATKLRFRTGDIIFGRRRVYQRKLAVADFDGICSAHAMVLRARPEVALPEFLPFFMQSDGFMERAKEISVGSLSPTINWKTLAREEFAPPSLEEQRQIAKILAGSKRSVEAMYDARECLDKCEHAYLIEAFGRAPGDVPAGLPVVLLRDLAEIRTGLAKGRRADASTTTRPYLRVANVKDGSLDLSQIKSIVVEKDKIERYSLRCGDVLMTEGGDLDKLGRGTVWQDEVRECLHQNHVFAVRTIRERLEPWYLAAVARSIYGRAYFLSCAKRTSNLASINKTQLSQFPIPLMEPTAQGHWVMTYQSIRAGVAALTTRLAEMTEAHQSLLGRLIEKCP